MRPYETSERQDETKKRKKCYEKTIYSVTFSELFLFYLLLDYKMFFFYDFFRKHFP